MKLCAYCRAPVVDSKTRDYCSDVCREEAALDAPRPTRKTTPEDIDKGVCIADDSTECDCPRCEAAQALARLFRTEANHDPHAITKCARSVEHETSPTDSERRHLLAEARAIEEEADEDVFSPLRTKVSG